jgi:Flp pilus assembly pilin Flp
MRNTSRATRLAAFAREESGQDLMEYGLLVSLIATFLVGAISNVGGSVFGLWEAIAAIQFTN